MAATASRCAHLANTDKYTHVAAREMLWGLLLTWRYEGNMNLVNSFLDWASGEGTGEDTGEGTGEGVLPRRLEKALEKA
jgi:hypothetical protein